MPEALVRTKVACCASDTRCSMACFRVLSMGPISRFWSPGTSLNAAIKSFTFPLRPK